MKIQRLWIYLKPGQYVADFKLGSHPSEFDYCIGSGVDGEFADWQIARLAQEMEKNRQASVKAES